MPQLIQPTTRVVARTEPTIGNLPVSQVTSAGVNPDFNSSVYNTQQSANARGVLDTKMTVPPKGTSFESVLAGAERVLGIGATAYGLFNQITQKGKETLSTITPTTISVAQANPGTKSSGQSAPATDSSNTIIIGTDKESQGSQQSFGSNIDFSFLAIAGLALFAVVALGRK